MANVVKESLVQQFEAAIPVTSLTTDASEEDVFL
jgi:hypothetical protein